MGGIGDHHRDFREHKKQRKARHQGQKQARDAGNTNNNSNKNNNNANQRCWDWMLVGGTNHYAKNRSSFITYRRAPCKIGNTRVLGIGTVKLDLVRSPSDSRTYTLILDDVLHIPDAVCNGISINPRFMAARNYTVLSWRDMAVGDVDTKEPLFYGEPYSDEHSLSRAVLAGNPRGASYLEKDVSYMLSVYASREDLEVLGKRVENRSL